MAPQRRSSRLQGGGVTPRKPGGYSQQLESLTERDETPKRGLQLVLDTLISSPAPRTPATSGRIKPAHEEMHPSKAHPSTAQEPDSGLRLGFTDIKASGNGQPSGALQQTPSKTGISESSFDFRFARPAPQLGPEAQRMMDELREEALRIKARLAAEREEEKQREGDNDSGIAGRKIAQPKGKVGRFSDVHMSQFRKMDSIAGHPSSFRAQPGRFTPTTNSLKRSPSKAQLDDKEEGHKRMQNIEASDRLENDAPAKRARKRVTDDTSSARPISRGGLTNPTTPISSRSQSNLASITTPTQASLSRAATAKTATQIPTLTRSPSKPNMGTFAGLTRSAQKYSGLSTIPKSTSKKILRSPSKFGRVRSILRYPSASKANTASGVPSLSQSPSKPNLDKALPSTPGGAGSKNMKHVNFTPDTVGKHVADTVQNSPSPMKSGIPRSTSKLNFSVRNMIKQSSATKSQENKVEYPSIKGLQNLGAQLHNVEYPSLAGVRPLPEPPRRAASQQPPPSVPGVFTFRSDSTIKFGASPQSFGSSPGQSSVRQVRPSILPNSMPGSFPGGNKENQEPLPSVPHGMSNKKRRRADSDDEREDRTDRSPKKLKGPVAEGHMLVAPKLQTENVSERKMATPGKKRGVLSLSRLNMLARPKNRK